MGRLRTEGKQVGTNSITALFGTGAIAEHWHGAGDIEGRSLNAYDEARGCWHQTWVDSTGSILLLDGCLLDGSMVLEGVAPSGADPSRLDRQRITWTPSDAGRTGAPALGGVERPRDPPGRPRSTAATGDGLLTTYAGRVPVGETCSPPRRPPG